VGTQAITEGDNLALSLSASDPNGDALSYSAAGLPSGAALNGQVFDWTPSFDQAGVYAVTFAVSDGTLVDSEIVTITVANTNRLPLANAGSDQTAESQALVTLNGTASSDPDGQNLSYSWIQTAGPTVQLHNPPPDQPTFTAPAVAGPTTLAFELTVSDGSLSSRDTVAVTVLPPASLSLITDVYVSTGKAYAVDPLVAGTPVYIDRSYTFVSGPAQYVGQEFIRTANDDKWVTASNYLVFSLTADATVYVAFDSKMTRPPKWIDGTWTKTSDVLKTTSASRQVYRKFFRAGRVTLGGNSASSQGSTSNYNVIAIPTP